MTGLRHQECHNRYWLRGQNEGAERENATMLDIEEGTLPFACECGDCSCTSTVCLTRAEYEDVRSLASHFLVARDHENPEMEAVIWENERWAIVEAVGRDAVMASRRSDPRQL